MASIVKRGKTYSIVYYEGEGKDRHQVWESGLSYNAAKARKAQLEYEVAQNIHIDRNDLTVSEFLYEFVEKYGEKKWVASTYDGNVGLLENYVHPYLGDKKLRSIRTKTVDDYYHFLLDGRTVTDGISILDAEHIIPLKMRAWLDLKSKKAEGIHVNARDIKKHRLDVFRLFQLVRENQRIPVPQSIMEDITRFIAQMRQEDIRLTDIGIRRSKDSILDIYSQMYITE